MLFFENKVEDQHDLELFELNLKILVTVDDQDFQNNGDKSKNLLIQFA